MATRPPNGLGEQDGKMQWDASRGDPASTPAGDARSMGAVVREGERFPYLADALEGKRDTDIVGVLNYQLRKHKYDEWERIDRVKTPTGEVKVEITKHKKPIRRTLEPFEVVEMTVAQARRMVAKFNRRMKNAPRLAVIILHGVAGDCGRQRRFEYNGTRFESCPFEKCSQPGHALKPWSVHRAQQFVITLRSPEAIDRFVRQFDQRPEVAMFAMSEAAARRAAIIANRMESAPAQSSAVI